MRLKVNSQKSKVIVILGSVLVPVFLFTMTVSSAAGNEEVGPEKDITFRLADSGMADDLFSDYSLMASPLFDNIYKARVSSQIFSALQTDHRVEYAEIDGKAGAFAITPNDPFFTADSMHEDRQWYLQKTGIPTAWQTTRGSQDVIVAIIDTGIHASHIELNDGRVIAGYNTIKNQPIPGQANSDDNGHGTAVAGVIGAIPNNSKGIAGVAWDIKLMPIKALASDGTGLLSAVAAGIVWAADNNANIINLSLGGEGYGADMTLSNAISYAYNRGVLIVAAAGNDLADHGINLDQSPVYPVCGDNGNNMVLGVAATDVNDQKASFSNFGSLCIDISAPGKKIITTAYLPSEQADNVLIYGSGTSLAAPLVSGIAALMKANNNNLSNVDLRNLIMRSADDIYPLNQNTCLNTSCNGFLGTGRINARLALAPVPVAEGSLIREVLTGDVYIISNNVRRRVSNFVFSQRGFDSGSVLSEASVVLSGLPKGSDLPPLEGTLIKSADHPQVYVIHGEVKRPVTYLVFISRAYSFANIRVLPQMEVNAYAAADWYWPPDGTMVLIEGNPTVYVMHEHQARPVTLNVFQMRNLSFSRVVRVTPDEFSHIPRPTDNYWMPPPESTLVKSATDPGIYLIENGAKRLLSYEAFVGRNYRFSNVRTLPQVEVDVIAPGLPLLNP